MRVKIYVEGGGDNDDTITRCRLGFAAYCANAAPRTNRPRVVPCGSRNQAFEKFKAAVTASAGGDFCVLLVDSEGPVGEVIAEKFLAVRDGWAFPQVEGYKVFLMVQTMEAWFLADRAALAAFYGNGFRVNSLPGSAVQIETIPKHDLEPSLKLASKATKTKGEYHKTKHGFDLLAKIDPAKIEAASPHAAEFNQFLRSL